MRWLAACGGLLLLAAAPVGATSSGGTLPNILVILTDDQGYGDLGRHGNPILRTPNLDRLAAEGVELSRFYVAPVCSPTRASLFTGRYHLRTGIVDTYLGRSMMFADEVTIAEVLGGAGYRTAIFGKWHLGDNYPMRPIDQGFAEALVLRGGGLGQPSDPIDERPRPSPYFDPLLEHNGRLERRAGYCSDIFAQAAKEFIEQPSSAPFFVALTFNGPHTPLEIDERYVRPFREAELGPKSFPAAGNPFPEPGPPLRESIARVYGMIQNIDENVGRVLEALDRTGKARDTLIVFFTDNGPQQPRYNGGLRDRKGSVLDGGIRVPCAVRWPEGLPAGRTVDAVAAHIDLMPTILAAAGVMSPAAVKLDGLDLLPLLRGEKRELPERTLFFQWHRGDRPQLGRAFAARNSRWKLALPLGAFVEGAGDTGGKGWAGSFLFDMQADPFERVDVAARFPVEAAKLWEGYRAWFEDVTATRGGREPRIIVGSSHQNPVTLTRQDWRGPQAGWQARAKGRWDLEVAAGGRFDVLVHFGPEPWGGKSPKVERARLVVERDAEPGTPSSPLVLRAEVAGKTSHRFEGVSLEAGHQRFWAVLEDGEGEFGAYQVELVSRGMARTDGR